MAGITLLGRLIFTGEIEALTGLHIGGATGGLDIGGVDLPVLRHEVAQEPYIPGSSLRGKIRCLLERELGLELNQSVGKEVKMHSCTEAQPYASCPVCKIFGVPGERSFAEPARLVVRDVHLSEESVRKLRDKRIGLPFTEVKTEVAIDRITSAATPRQHERVPAGAVFSPCEMIFSIYRLADSGTDGDLALVPQFLKAMELLEDDYLGGQGTRGSGKIKFRNFSVVYKPRGYYDREEGVEPVELGRDLDVKGLRTLDLQKVRQTLEPARGA